MNDQKTHFGFEQVKQSDKVNRVNHVFNSVASRYDIMNDLMSFGLHPVVERSRDQPFSIATASPST